MTRPNRQPVVGFHSGFAHLHVRSGFSYGLGTATPEELAGAAAWMGYSAMALTDRNGLYGIPRFLKACGEHGLSPIVGAEGTVVDVALERSGPRAGEWLWVGTLD